MSGAELHAQPVLSNKISASELSRKSALLVGKAAISPSRVKSSSTLLSVASNCLPRGGEIRQETDSSTCGFFCFFAWPLPRTESQSCTTAPNYYYTGGEWLLSGIIDIIDVLLPRSVAPLRGGRERERLKEGTWTTATWFRRHASLKDLECQGKIVCLPQYCAFNLTEKGGSAPPISFFFLLFGDLLVKWQWQRERGGSWQSKRNGLTVLLLCNYSRARIVGRNGRQVEANLSTHPGFPTFSV